MFDDENEKMVNSPEEFTPAAPAEPQVSPTEFSMPAAPETTETTVTPDIPAAPEDFCSTTESDSIEDSGIDISSGAPVEETPVPATEPAAPQVPVNNNFNRPQTNVYNPNFNGYRENPYSPYSDRAPYVNNNNMYNQPQANSYNPNFPPAPPIYGGQGPVQNGAPKKKKTGKIILAILAIILVFAIGFGSAAALLSKSRKSSNNYNNSNSNSSSDSTLNSNGTGDDRQLDIQPTPSGEVSSTSEIAEKARLSNVGILIYTNSTSSSVSGEGSGVVMDVDSTGEYTYIITCAHVIDTQGATVKVQTEDGTVYDAEVVGYDTRTDLGVVRVHATGFTPAEFGNSDDLVVGDPVYAIGNPGGVEFFGTFTGGYVSAINRPISSEIGYTMKCIQHDASINPGNSGGMLVNKYGQVIGINSQKIAATNYEGMGFAIPISDAKPIVESLITYGYVPNRPKLGITYYPTSSITQYAIISQVNNLPSGSLVIATINSDSAFSGTDVRKGDMIVAVNGKDMDTADVLLETIDSGKVGDKLTLTIARVDSNYSVSKFDVTVTLVEDRGTEVQEETTQSYNPYSYFGY